MRGIRLAGVALAWGAAAGCQTYAPAPLDWDAHEREWVARDPHAPPARGPSAPQADPAATHGALTLSDAEWVALAYNAELRVARAKAGVATAGAAQAGRWDDPNLDVDVLRIIRSVPNPWIVSTSVGFSIPISGRLGIEKALATAQSEEELWRVAVAERDLKTKLRMAWVAWSAELRRAALIEQHLEKVAKTLELAGTLRRAGAISAAAERALRLEQVIRQGELAQASSRGERARVGLLSLMGLKPRAPATLSPQETWTTSAVPANEREEALAKTNPEMGLAAAALGAVEREFELEIRRQYPDLTIGPALASEDGSLRLGAALGGPVPILNANRRAIAEARARRDAARVEVEATRERLVAELARVESEWASAAEQRQRITNSVAPLVDEQLAEIARLGKLGEIDALLVLDTLGKAHATGLSLLEAQVEESQAAIALDALTPATNTKTRSQP